MASISASKVSSIGVSAHSTHFRTFSGLAEPTMQVVMSSLAIEILEGELGDIDPLRRAVIRGLAGDPADLGRGLVPGRELGIGQQPGRERGGVHDARRPCDLRYGTRSASIVFCSV